jgi:trk system potassium uptake protein TrkH
MSALGLPFETALSSVIVTLNNIGPGIDLISADSDFSEIPVVGKMFLTLCMALGRLEMFSVCVLFIPSFWKHS